MTKDKLQKYVVVINSRLNDLAVVERFTERVAEETGMSAGEIDNLAIAVTEAVNNAIIHGNRRDESKKVYITFTVSHEEISVVIKDEGNGFDPNALRNPLAPENILKESGRGIFILRTLMDSVEFKFTPTGTATIMKKWFTVK